MVYHIKCSLRTINNCNTKLKSQVNPPTDSYNSPPPRDTGVKVTTVARPLLALVAQNLCSCESGVFTSREFANSRTFLAIIIVREAFCSVYAVREVSNETTDS